MSLRIVIIACLLAATLGVVVYFLAPASTNAPDATGPLLDFDPARVKRITITEPNADAHTIASTTDRGWAFLSADDQTPDLAWPVDPRYPRALLRALDSTQRNPADETASPPANAITVTLTFLDDTTHTATLDARAVGGQARAWVDGEGPFMVGADVLDATASPPAWRIPTAMPGVTRFNVASIALRTPDESILLTKRQNRWFVDEPISSRVSPAAITAALEAFATLDAVRFIDRPDPPTLTAANFDNPTLVAELTLSQPPASDEPPTIVSLSVGGPFSPDGSTALAQSSRAPDTALVIPTATLDPLPSKVEGFLPTTATGLTPADIGTITITSDTTNTQLTRELDTWSGIFNDEQRKASPANRDLADSIIAFLTQSPGTPTLRSAIQDLPSATIELRDLSGDLLESIDIVVSGGGEGDGITEVGLANGEAMVVYPKASLPPGLSKAIPPVPNATGLSTP